MLSQDELKAIYDDMDSRSDEINKMMESMQSLESVWVDYNVSVVKNDSLK